MSEVYIIEFIFIKLLKKKTYTHMFTILSLSSVRAGSLSYSSLHSACRKIPSTQQVHMNYCMNDSTIHKNLKN